MGKNGWPDKNGDIWVPDLDMHGGGNGEEKGGWRVHSPNGQHRHVYPNGKERVHRYSCNECWGLGGHNFYEVMTNGGIYLTDIPPEYATYYNSSSFLFLPMITGIPIMTQMPSATLIPSLAY